MGGAHAFGHGDAGPSPLRDSSEEQDERRENVRHDNKERLAIDLVSSVQSVGLLRLPHGQQPHKNS